jgi:2'-5' RNA ligase
MIRSFIAIELPPNLRAALSRLQAQLKAELLRELGASAGEARLQWVKPDSIHLTLKFLGDFPEEQVSALRQALTPVMETQTSFALPVGGVGVFPDLRAPRVLWVGVGQASVNPEQSIQHLAKTIDRVMAALGCAPESKPFAPHLTLARIKTGGRDVGRALASLGICSSPTMVGTLEVCEVALIKSDLQPSGAVYSRLFSVPLAGSSNR